jgi:hypothetical protein
MLKKSLIALLLVAICSGPALAHVTWGYGVTTTIKWEWDKKPGPDIPVKMKVVMWANLYFRYNSKDHKDLELILKQQGNGNFYDCIDLLLCCNFEGIKVEGKFVPNADGKKVVTTKDNKAFRISVKDGHAHDAHPGGWSDWKEQPSQSLQVNTLHLTGNEKVITICLEMKDVDPQALPYQNLVPVQIGTVFTTLQPTLAPPGLSGSGSQSWSEYVQIIP